jgi:signal transduction histidine kinase
MATIAAVSVFFVTALKSNLDQEVDASLDLRASNVVRAISATRETGLEPSRLPSDLLELPDLEEFSAPGIYVQVLDSSGTIVASSPNLPGGKFPSTQTTLEEARAGREARATVPVGRERVRMLARPIMNDDKLVGIVLVGESLHALEITIQRAQQLAILAAIGAGLAALVSGWWLTANALGPIAEITRVAHRIAQTGDFQRRISAPRAQDELGQLTATFNEMLDRLENTLQHQREFLADVSHELRSPLMVIRGNLDLLKLGLREEERQECAREATEEVERMSRMISDLLFLAEVDAKEMMEHQPVALHEVVSEVWQRAKTLDAGKHEISIEHDDQAVVMGDRGRLGQMLWNLVENARRYTDDGGQITISLRNHGQVAELVVSDTGIGISSEHQARVFDRFYRIDQARSRNEGSTGLGLAIVKQIVEAHNGQVRLRSEPDEGSIFTVALPTATL